MWRLVIACLSISSIVACHSTARDSDMLISRATFELKCPRSQLRWTDLGEDTVGVEGCGARRTYLWVCSGTCRWIANGGN